MICKVEVSMSISFEAGHDYAADTEKEQGDEAKPIAVFKDEGRYKRIANHQSACGAKRGFDRGDIELVFHKINRLKGDIA